MRTYSVCDDVGLEICKRHIIVTDPSHTEIYDRNNPDLTESLMKKEGGESFMQAMDALKLDGTYTPPFKPLLAHGNHPKPKMGYS